MVEGATSMPLRTPAEWAALQEKGLQEIATGQRTSPYVSPQEAQQWQQRLQQAKQEEARIAAQPMAAQIIPSQPTPPVKSPAEIEAMAATGANVRGVQLAGVLTGEETAPPRPVANAEGYSRAQYVENLKKRQAAIEGSRKDVQAQVTKRFQAEENTGPEVGLLVNPQPSTNRVEETNIKNLAKLQRNVNEVFGQGRPPEELREGYRVAGVPYQYAAEPTARLVGETRGTLLGAPAGASYAPAEPVKLTAYPLSGKYITEEGGAPLIIGAPDKGFMASAKSKTSKIFPTGLDVGIQGYTAMVGGKERKVGVFEETAYYGMGVLSQPLSIPLTTWDILTGSRPAELKSYEIPEAKSVLGTTRPSGGAEAVTWLDVALTAVALKSVPTRAVEAAKIEAEPLRLKLTEPSAINVDVQAAGRAGQGRPVYEEYTPTGLQRAGQQMGVSSEAIATATKKTILGNRVETFLIESKGRGFVSNQPLESVASVKRLGSGEPINAVGSFGGTSDISRIIPTRQVKPVARPAIQPTADVFIKAPSTGKGGSLNFMGGDKPSGGNIGYGDVRVDLGYTKPVNVRATVPLRKVESGTVVSEQFYGSATGTAPKAMLPEPASPLDTLPRMAYTERFAPLPAKGGRLIPDETGKLVFARERGMHEVMGELPEVKYGATPTESELFVMKKGEKPATQPSPLFGIRKAGELRTRPKGEIRYAVSETGVDLGGSLVQRKATTITAQGAKISTVTPTITDLFVVRTPKGTKATATFEYKDTMTQGKKTIPVNVRGTQMVRMRGGQLPSDTKILPSEAGVYPMKKVTTKDVTISSAEDTQRASWGKKTPLKFPEEKTNAISIEISKEVKGAAEKTATAEASKTVSAMLDYYKTGGGSRLKTAAAEPEMWSGLIGRQPAALAVGAGFAQGMKIGGMQNMNIGVLPNQKQPEQARTITPPKRDIGQPPLEIIWNRNVQLPKERPKIDERLDVIITPIDDIIIPEKQRTGGEPPPAPINIFFPAVPVALGGGFGGGGGTEPMRGNFRVKKAKGSWLDLLSIKVKKGGRRK